MGKVKTFRSDLTADRLRELLVYDPISGEFRWKPGRRGARKSKDQAGRVNASGYREICVDYYLYTAQRLAWFYVTGRWPKEHVDHVDMNRDNNAWSNLRECTRAQNQANTTVRKSNRSGFKGVFTRTAAPGRWYATIRENGRRRNLGTFYTPEAASAAYEAALLETHGEYGRLK